MTPERRASAVARCEDTARKCDGGTARESVACARSATHNPTVVGWPVAERVAFGPDASCVRSAQGRWTYHEPSAVPYAHPRAPPLLALPSLGFALVLLAVALFKRRR